LRIIKPNARIPNNAKDGLIGQILPIDADCVQAPWVSSDRVLNNRIQISRGK
jgi:hypothetical protein